MDKCLFCNKEFIKTVHNKKYCSNTCGDKDYRLKNIVKIKEWVRINKPWLKQDKERAKMLRKIRDTKNALKLIEYRKRYYSNPLVKQRQAEWCKKNMDRKRAYSRKYNLNPITNLHNRLRRSLNHRLENKHGKTSKLLPYTFEQLKNHIESNFLEGMGWENRNLWDIDHKIPVTFAKNDKEVIELYSLDNLQPLWKKDNISKSNKRIADLFGSGSWFK